MMTIFTTVFQFSWPYSSFYLVDKHWSPIMCYTLNSTNDATVNKTDEWESKKYTHNQDYLSKINGGLDNDKY